VTALAIASVLGISVTRAGKLKRRELFAVGLQGEQPVVRGYAEDLRNRHLKFAPLPVSVPLCDRGGAWPARPDR